MHEEGEHVEEEEVEGEVLLPVAVVVLYVVAVVLYRIEDLVLYHPAGPSDPDQLLAFSSSTGKSVTQLL